MQEKKESSKSGRSKPSLTQSLGSDISLDFTGFHDPDGVGVQTREVGVPRQLYLLWLDSLLWRLLFSLSSLRVGCDPKSWYGQSCHPNPFAYCFLLCSVGELNFDLLTSSNNLTATVESNAATEKKPLVLKGSRPCGGVRRARMQRELFSQQHGLQ